MVQILVLLAACVLGCSSGPTGAPDLAPNPCTNLIPGAAHEPNSASTPSPVVVTAEPQNAQGTVVRVTLTRNDGGVYRGFLIQARDATGATVGTFSVDDVIAKQTCQTNGGSSVTHTSNNEKTSVTVEWGAPAGFSGTVSFWATISEVNLPNGGLSRYWDNNQSNAIQVTP